MTTVLKVHLKDLNSQFIQDIQQKYGMAAEVEIHVYEQSSADNLLSEAGFWQVIDSIDWSKNKTQDKLQPAITMLSEMPVSHMYLFADKLSEKLFLLDTQKHAKVFSANEPEGYLSADDFLYARCAVVAEGKDFYEKVLNDPSQMPDSIVFEPLLNLAHFAFKLKTGVEFNYRPAFNYETFSNKAGWN